MSTRGTRAGSAGRWARVAVAGFALGAAPAVVAADGLSLEAGGEGAGVQLAGASAAWWAGRLQLEYRSDGSGGALVAFEPQRRWGATEHSWSAGGHRRFGGWTVAARGGVTPDAAFYYRWTAGGELSRRLSAGWVAGAAFRRLEFASASVDLWTPSLTRYAGWGEAQLRVTLADNRTLATRSRSALVRGLWNRGARLQLGGGLALGENLYDVTALAGRPARGFVAFAHGRVAVGPREALGVELRYAHEQPRFRQVALGCYVRRAF